ncbi:MAG: hypothetical protein ACRYFX_31005 [Janthinobacterium lividum]
MILVVEGISASGKSTWCAQHPGRHLVPETGRLAAAPDRDAEPEAAAAFWASQNAARWQAALAVEHASGLAICDTDPLKLHYAWSLWQLGAAPEAHWRQELAATRQHFRQQRIGFADAYFIKEIDPAQAHRQRAGDPTRSRRNFDLHLRLQPALLAWYAALGAVLPGRVQYTLPAVGVVPQVAGLPTLLRYDVGLLDQAMSLLPLP